MRNAVSALIEGVDNPPSAHVLYCSADLTVLQVTSPPHIYGVPHDHAGWAVIGVFDGAECFNQYRCDDGVTLVHDGYDAVCAGDVRILPAELINYN
ncbi:MAG: hypothetical protein NVS3B28_28380 [Candidatus Velthaea sp.]